MDNKTLTIHCLQNTLLFAGLSEEQLTTILVVAQRQIFQKGDFIFKQKEMSRGFFIVKSGRVKVFNVSATGKEQILNIFESGENFAEVAALDGKPFPASAATLEPTELIFFPRQGFLQLLHHHPDIAINMLIGLSRHLRHLTSVIEELSFKDVPQRLATYLLKLKDAHLENLSRSDESPIIVTLDLSKTELAAMLGTIPATLSRAFYALKSDGLITINGSQIELIDYHRLQALSQKFPMQS